MFLFLPAHWDPEFAGTSIQPPGTKALKMAALRELTLSVIIKLDCKCRYEEVSSFREAMNHKML